MLCIRVKKRLWLKHKKITQTKARGHIISTVTFFFLSFQWIFYNPGIINKWEAESKNKLKHCVRCIHREHDPSRPVTPTIHFAPKPPPPMSEWLIPAATHLPSCPLCHPHTGRLDFLLILTFPLWGIHFLSVTCIFDFVSCSRGHLLSAVCFIRFLSFMFYKRHFIRMQFVSTRADIKKNQKQGISRIHTSFPNKFSHTAIHRMEYDLSLV